MWYGRMLFQAFNIRFVWAVFLLFFLVDSSLAGIFYYNYCYDGGWYRCSGNPSLCNYNVWNNGILYTVRKKKAGTGAYTKYYLAMDCGSDAYLDLDTDGDGVINRHDVNDLDPNVHCSEGEPDGAGGCQAGLPHSPGDIVTSGVLSGSLDIGVCASDDGCAKVCDSGQWFTLIATTSSGGWMGRARNEACTVGGGDDTYFFTPFSSITVDAHSWATSAQNAAQQAQTNADQAASLAGTAAYMAAGYSGSNSGAVNGAASDAQNGANRASAGSSSAGVAASGAGLSAAVMDTVDSTDVGGAAIGLWNAQNVSDRKGDADEGLAEAIAGLNDAASALDNVMDLIGGDGGDGSGGDGGGGGGGGGGQGDGGDDEVWGGFGGSSGQYNHTPSVDLARVDKQGLDAFEKTWSDVSDRFTTGWTSSPIGSSLSSQTFNIPAGSCPEASFMVWGETITIRAHCDLWDSISGFVSAVMLGFYTLLAVMRFIR